MVARQEGREFPYPPSVEGAGPWGDRGLAEDGAEEQVPSGTQRSRRRQARVMRATPKKSEAVDVRAEDLDREDGVPPQWEELLERQEGIIDDLLAEQS